MTNILNPSTLRPSGYLTNNYFKETTTNYENEEKTLNKKPVRIAAVVPKYTPLLYTLLFLLLIDFLINSFSEMLVFESIAMLVIYMFVIFYFEFYKTLNTFFIRIIDIYLLRVQDLCISFSALVLLIMLINTYMFQAGLMGFMIGKFKSVWILTVLYFGLCVGLQVWLMFNRWSRPLEYLWNQGQIALYVIQRFASILYYYIYKRTAYRLSDSRFYEDSDWLRKEFERRH